MKYKTYLLLIIVLCAIVYAITVPDKEEITLLDKPVPSLPDKEGIVFLDGPQDLVTDSCTYSTGDWVVDCADNCLIINDVDVGGNDILISGFGNFSTIADISNYANVEIRGDSVSNQCIVECSGGGCFI